MILHNHEKPNMELGGITTMQKLAMANPLLENAVINGGITEIQLQGFRLRCLG